jgi:thiamine kinase-like enzyme
MSSDKKFSRINELSKFTAETRTLGNSLVEIQKQLERANLPRQIIHQDFCPSNVLFRKNEEPIVIDFEIARLDWRVIDLISGWERFCKNRAGLNTKTMKIFLHAYQREVRLSENEFKYIPLVWKYLNLTNSIFNFHKFCITGSRPSLVYGYRSLKNVNSKAGAYNFVKDLIRSNDLNFPS